MHRYFRYVLIAGLLLAGGAALSGCIMVPARRGVWVPAYWAPPHIWVGGHWRHR